MRRTLPTPLLGLVLAFALGGCATLRHETSSADPGSQDGQPAPEVGLPDAPGPRLSLGGVGLPPIVVEGAPPHADAGQAITRRDSIVLAARASMLGNLLDAKARECCRAATPAGGTAGLHHPQSVAPARPGDIQAEIPRVAALEARNRAAGASVSLFHRLGQAVAQRQAIGESLQVVDAALAERKLFAERGMPIPEGLRALSGRRLDLLTAASQLDQAITQASAELRNQLNVASPDPAAPLWPVDEILVDDRPINPDAEVEQGLARRPEVALLHRLDAARDPASLRSLQHVLSAFHPLLGVACEPPEVGQHPVALLALLKRLKEDAASEARDLAATRRVWDAYRVERERQIAREIRLAAIEVRTTLDRVRVARERVAACRADLDELDLKADQQINTFAARTEARLALISARSSLWEAVTAYLVAEARLHQEQFRLL